MSETHSTSAARPNRLRAKKQRAMLWVYVAGLLLAFGPSKALGQIAPLLVAAALIFVVQIRPIYHLAKLSLALLLYLAAGLLYWAVLPEFWWPGYLLFFVTGSAALFLLFDFSPLLDAAYMMRLGTITLAILAVESLLGLAQFAGAISRFGLGQATGDFVWGTIAPPLNPYYAGSSPFFVVLLSTLALFVLAATPAKLRLRQMLGFGLVFLCWMAASLLHSVIYFVAAVVGALTLLAALHPKQPHNRLTARLRKARRQGTMVILAGVLILFIAGPFVYASNYARISTVLRSVTEFGPYASFLKVRTIYFTLLLLPQDVSAQPLIGIGPGQYASRAALMVSGEYLSRASLPFIQPHFGSYAGRYILPYFGQLSSSNHFPSSSWMALYGELGAVGIIAILLGMGRAVWRFCRLASLHFPRMHLAALILLLYVGLMGLQNVYWEYTQAIFPAVLALKLMYDYMGQENRAQRAREIAPDIRLSGQPSTSFSL